MFLIGTLEKIWVLVYILSKTKPHCGVSIHRISENWVQVATTAVSKSVLNWCEIPIAITRLLQLLQKKAELWNKPHLLVDRLGGP